MLVRHASVLYHQMTLVQQNFIVPIVDSLRFVVARSADIAAMSLSAPIVDLKDHNC